jgi:hypothetical protein
MQPSGPDDEFSGCFEGVEPVGAGADGPGEAFRVGPGDLVMLGGEPGQGLGAEAGELAIASGSGGHRAALRRCRAMCLVAKVVLMSELLPGPVRRVVEAGCVALDLQRLKS